MAPKTTIYLQSSVSGYKDGEPYVRDYGAPLVVGVDVTEEEAERMLEAGLVSYDRPEGAASRLSGMTDTELLSAVDSANADRDAAEKERDEVKAELEMTKAALAAVTQPDATPAATDAQTRETATDKVVETREKRTK